MARGIKLTRRRLLATGAATGVVACSGGGALDDTAVTDSGPSPWPTLPPEPLLLSKAPWVQPLDLGRVRLRFEARTDAPVAVRVVGEGLDTVFTPAVRSDVVDFQRTIYGDFDQPPDEPGDHVLYEVLLDDLVPSGLYTWVVRLGGGSTLEGSFRAPAAPGQAARVAWLADTMWPNAEPTAVAMLEVAPDLVIHGGDIQYEDNPVDTWNGYFRAMAPLHAVAPIALAVGNHEYETETEAQIMFDRLLGGQGRPGPGGGGKKGAAARFFRVDVGSLCLLFMDSETTSLSDPTHPQQPWLDAQLAEAKADKDVAHVVVCFHRPVYSLSKHHDSGIGQEAAVRQRFADGGVSAVLQGHVHAFELFDIDGIAWWVDGGGGAFLYNPDAELHIAQKNRPDVVAARTAVFKTYGFTTLDIAEDGTLTLRRFNVEDPLVPEYERVIPRKL